MFFAAAQQRHQPHRSSSRSPPEGILNRLQCPMCEWSVSYLTTLAAFQSLQCQEKEEGGNNDPTHNRLTSFIESLASYVATEEEKWDTDVGRRAVAMRSVLLSYIGLEPSWVIATRTHSNDDDDIGFYLEQPAGRGSVDPALERVPLVVASKKTGVLSEGSCSLAAFDAIVRPLRRQREHYDEADGDAENPPVTVPSGGEKRPLPRSTKRIVDCWHDQFSNNFCVSNSTSTSSTSLERYVSAVYNQICEKGVILLFPAVESPVPKGDPQEHWHRAKQLARKERSTSMSPHVQTTLQHSCVQVLHDNAQVVDKLTTTIARLAATIRLPSVPMSDHPPNQHVVFESGAQLATDLFALVVEAQNALCLQACQEGMMTRRAAAVRGKPSSEDQGRGEGDHHEEKWWLRPTGFPQVPIGTAFNALGGRQRLHLRHLVH